MRLIAIGGFISMLTLGACADYVYQRGCNPPLGSVFKCK